MLAASKNSTDPNLCKFNKMEEFVNGTNNCDVERPNGLAVAVSNLEKSLNGMTSILAKLNMNVSIGAIYGLVGPSGCGKSTLLSCIVGMQTWDAGEILLFGQRVSKMPKAQLGFMPQEIALHTHLSIKETFEYYGKIYGLSTYKIDEEYKRFVDLLNLPSHFVLVGDLSGGQRRRVSLAVTLMHNPMLLILDEPTVGLDPLVREGIWAYLRHLVNLERTTIIITTHYIEETRSSNLVGIMRNGRLLVEDTPFALMQQHNCILLEQIVLKLSQEDDNSYKMHSLRNNHVQTRKLPPTPEFSCSNGRQRLNFKIWGHEKQNLKQSSTFSRVTAISGVVCKIFVRNVIFMAIILLLPPLQIVLTLATLGSPPKNLAFGMVENENCFANRVIPSNVTCNLHLTSCSLIAELSLSDTFSLVPIESVETARSLVQQGNLWGYFYFPKNHSSHLTELLLENKFSTNVTLEGSKFQLTMDMSNYYVSTFAIYSAIKAYESYMANVAGMCNMDPQEFKVPMQFREAIENQEGIDHKMYHIPVIILTLTFEIPMAISAFLVINDRRQGTLRRGQIAGVQYLDILISHMTIMGFLIFAQTGFTIVLLYVGYEFRPLGSILLLYFLCVMGGFSGQGLGLLLGVLFDEEANALLSIIFLLTNMYYLEGGLWPIQAIPSKIRKISYSLPMTYLLESIRTVTYRGGNLGSIIVWYGIGVSLGWTILFWLGCVILSYFRHMR